MRRRGRPRKKICLICDKEIRKGQPQRLIPLDRPYGNLFAHQKCWNETAVIKAIDNKKEAILSGKYGFLTFFD